ncbi:MAG: neutral/alkaline non-lysosomal ceramidase N-terminal domain-containing protein, partial [Cyclobacteriaceae bacterium]|nr:neutral/alkaline non-lysosomal ceramidase N-terminal domain-containing protein [Cyclobacteriaceae bacterium]
MTKLQKRSQKTLFLCLLYIALQAGMEKKAMAENTNDDPDRKFRAAIVKTDITPDGPQTLLGYAPRTSTSIHDRIYHRILLLDDGDTEFVLVSTEVCEFSPEIYDQVAAQLKKKTGIAPDHFLWTVTHTHSAPEFGPAGLAEVFLGERYTHEYDKDYMNFVIDKLLEGIIQARKALEPARLGTGWGHAQANINRRARDTDGTTTLGLNPDGPVDRRIGLIRIDKANGSPMVLLANYAIHDTVLGGSSTVISGDAPGVVAAYVEE